MLTQGEVLRNRYRVIRQLGQGGMGAVYEAHDNVFETSVALKQVTINLSSVYDTKAQEMAQLAFEREAKILAKVNHENVPHVKDYFTEDDCQYLVMELVDGEDLGKLLNTRKAPFPAGSVIEWTDRVLDALDYLHSQDPPVIHRDIKPQNLKLTSRQKIKLLDFGIAKGSDISGADTVTNQTFIAATLNYSPIEQMLRVLDPTFLAVITHKYSEQIETVLGQTADGRSDIFALGATMYHLATNSSPAEAVKRAIKIWDGEPDPIVDPAQINPEISREFADFLLKSMQIRRESRFSSAAEMRSALQSIVDFAENPTLKKTVSLSDRGALTGAPGGSSEHLSSQETAVFEHFGSQTTEPIVDFDSVETAALSEVDNDRNTPDYESFENSESDLQPTRGFQTGDTSPRQSIETSEIAHLTSPKSSRKKSVAIWLVPVLGLLLLVIGGAGFGAWYLVNNSGRNIFPADNSNLSTASNSNTDTNPGTSGQQGLGLSLANSDDGSNSEDPNSNTAPKVSPTPAISTPTPVPQQVSKPGTQKPSTRKPPTPKPPTPKPKNMDCIFTDSCG